MEHAADAVSSRSLRGVAVTATGCRVQPNALNTATDVWHVPSFLSPPRTSFHASDVRLGEYCEGPLSTAR